MPSRRASICNTKRYWRILVASAKTGDFGYFQPMPLVELAEFSNSAESAQLEWGRHSWIQSERRELRRNFLQRDAEVAE
jgi:hypothetical protein